MSNFRQLCPIIFFHVMRRTLTTTHPDQYGTWIEIWMQDDKNKSENEP